MLETRPKERYKEIAINFLEGSMGQHQCLKCGDVLVNLDRLKTHTEKRVCERKPFKCICGSRFERPLDESNRSYQRHLKERCEGKPKKTSIAALEDELDDYLQLTGRLEVELEVAKDELSHQKRRFEAEVYTLKKANKTLQRRIAELEQSAD